MNNNWPPTSNAEEPFIDPGFRQKLLELGGEWNGLPRLRVVWGQSPLASIVYRGRHRLKYLYKTEVFWKGWKTTSFGKNGQVKSVKMIKAPYANPPHKALGLIVEPVWEEHDIGIPRFFVEQLLHPNVVAEGWEIERYGSNPDTGEVEDLLGPAPNIYYEDAFYMIASHDKCEKRVGVCVPGCRGEYRAPEQMDIAYVQWLLKELEKENYSWGWDEIPSPEVVAEALIAQKKASAERRFQRVIATEELFRKEILAGRRRKGAVSVPSLQDIKGDGPRIV